MHLAVEQETAEPTTARLSSWKYLWRALREPARSQADKGLLRQLLLKPRMFDLLSCVMQLRSRGQLTALQGPSPFDDPTMRRAHDHNARVTATKVVSTSRRSEYLYQILSVPSRDLSREQLLIIGPRNAQELLTAWLYGYSWRRIQAIDLYSLHPKIRMMNMEQMTFTDGTFDAVVTAHTLPYAKDVFRCLSEVHRVLKPSGRFVFNTPHMASDTGWTGHRLLGQELRLMLRQLSFDLFHYHAFDKMSRGGIPQTTHVFGVQKRDGHPRVDPIEW